MGKDAPTLEEQMAGMQQQVGTLTQTIGTMLQQQDIPYYQYKAEFANIPRRKTNQITEIVLGAVDPLLRFAGETGSPEQPPGERLDYIPAPSGRILYANGVIADPETGDVLYKPGSVVPGSSAWRLKIQDEWSDQEANTWRKRLLKLGYVPQGGLAEKGGMGHDLLAALTMYHEMRYANYGKVQKMTATSDIGTREAIRESVDYQSLKTWAKTLGQVPFGEDLADEEADFLADSMVRKMVELQKEHPTWTPEQVQSGAETRVMNKFLKDPQVAGLVQEQEDQEVSYKIRDSVVSLSQALGA